MHSQDLVNEVQVHRHITKCGMYGVALQNGREKEIRHRDGIPNEIGNACSILALVKSLQYIHSWLFLTISLITGKLPDKKVHGIFETS